MRKGVFVLVICLLLSTLLVIYITQPLMGTTTARSGVTVDPARLEKHVKTISQELGARDCLHPENLDQVARYIEQGFRTATATVSDQKYLVDTKPFRNVIGQFGPDTPERIIVGAHYDTCGPRPGADDNASGVAGLIELAHLLGQTKLKTRVELVAYTLEEPPYFRTQQMGSAVHARSLKSAGTKVRAMVSLEMIGYFTDAENSQTYPLPGLSVLYPSKGNFIAVVGITGQASLVRTIKQAMTGASSLPVYSINAPASVPALDFSDQLNYWNEGYPAVMITDTSFFRNANYHQKTDTADTLDYKRMAQVVEGVFAAVKELSDIK
ncbi:MAG TPA: M28 family peptidase [Acidobacteriota bacterium]|nr:M28 family peptidase [Acidobacteriota bacterium]